MLALIEDAIHDVMWSDDLIDEWEHVIVFHHGPSGATVGAGLKVAAGLYGAGCGLRTAAVTAWSFADLFPSLQPFDVPGELRCGGRRDPVRDRYVAECLGEVGQSGRDDLFCFPNSERVPAFCLADQVDGADTPVIEAAVDGESEVAVDPPLLKEIRDGIVDVGELAASGKVEDAEVLGVRVIVAEEH